MERHIQFIPSGADSPTAGLSANGVAGTTFFYASLRAADTAWPVAWHAGDRYLLFVLNGRCASRWPLAHGLPALEIPAYACQAVVLPPGATDVGLASAGASGSFALHAIGFSGAAARLLSEDFPQVAALWAAAELDPAGVYALPARFLPPTVHKYLDRLRQPDKKGFLLNTHRKETLYQVVKRYHDALQTLQPRSKATDDAELLRRAEALIAQYLGEPGFTVDRLAQLLGVSRRNLYRLFETQGQLTPQRAIVVARLGKARELLRQNTHSVSEVTAIMGFNNPPHFSTLYKQVFGISPKEER